MAKDDSARRGKGSARDDDEDRPRRRPRDDEDDEDEEEDRPRRRRARDEEEDEDRPRRRPRDDDDEEEEEDRPRRRRPSRDEDDEPRRKRRPRDEDEDDDEDSEEEEDEDKPRKGPTRKKWEKVHLGMGFSIAYAAMVLGFIACIALSQVLVLVAGFLAWAALAEMAGVLVLIAALLFIGWEIPAVVGCALFLNTPNKRGTLPFAIASLVIGSINLLVRIIFIVLPLLDQGMGGMSVAAFSVAALILLIVGDAEFIIFPFYMKATMNVLRDKYLAESTNIPIALACGEIGFKIVLVFVVSVKTVRGEGGVGMVATILGVVWLLVMLFFALSYLKTILAVRRRVATKLPPPSEDMP